MVARAVYAIDPPPRLEIVMARVRRRGIGHRVEAERGGLDAQARLPGSGDGEGDPYDLSQLSTSWVR